MRKTFKLIAILSIAIAVFSCDKPGELEFNVPARQFTFFINPSPAGTYTLDKETIKIGDLKSEAAKNGINVDDITSVKATKVTFELLDGADNCNALSSGSFSMSNEPIKKNGQKIIKISSVPQGVKTFEVKPEDIELKPFSEDTLLSLDGTVTTNAEIKTKLKVRVTVDGKAKYKVLKNK